MKEEYDAFYRSYAEEKAQGLRIYTLKISVDDFMKLNPFHLENPVGGRRIYYTSDFAENILIMNPDCLYSEPRPCGSSVS